MVRENCNEGDGLIDMGIQLEVDRLNVVVIDQNEFIREGIHCLLDKEMMYHIVCSSDRFTGLHELESNMDGECRMPVDLLLIDMRAFFASQREIGQLVAETGGDMKVLVMLGEKDKQMFSQQLATQAAFPYYVNGFLDKGIGLTHLLAVMQIVMQAGLYVQPKDLAAWNKVMERSYHHGQGTVDDSYKQSRPKHMYTRREWDIIELLVKGYRNQEIADYLRISDKTVKNHLSNIFKKMQVNDRVKVVLHAIRNEWIEI